MADSSLVKKLGIKPGNRVLILNAPQAFAEMLGPLPEGVQQFVDADGTFDVVHLFVKNRAELAQYGPAAIRAVKPNGMFWISYPKRSSKVETDLTRDVGWDLVREAGFEGIAIISIDTVWSALRFRPSELVRRSRPHS